MSIIENIKNIFSRGEGELSQNAVQINQGPQQLNPVSMFCSSGANLKFRNPLGTTYLYTIVGKILDASKNITFKSKNNSIIIADIIHFIDSNCQLLIHQYMRLGFVCVFYNDKREYYIPNDNELKYDSKGRIINKKAVVMYSPEYQTHRGSKIKDSVPLVNDLNTLSLTKQYILDTLGVFGILSGQEIPLSPEGKRQLLKGLEENYGMADGKYKYLLSSGDLKYTQINPPIKDLNINNDIKEIYKLLANFFGVPIPLLLDDSSTYNNIIESKKYFYDTTIRSYAEVLLKVAQALLTASNEYILKSVITYRLENVPELETTLSAACSERVAYLKYLMELKNAGVNVDKQLNDLQTDLDTLMSV